MVRRIQHIRKSQAVLMEAEQILYDERQRESLCFLFNEYFKLLDNTLSTISHETIRTWFRTFFPRHGVSPVQTDYCDTCSEIKNQMNSAKISIQHMNSNGSTNSSCFEEKQVILNYYQSLLDNHRQLATNEQNEYKDSIETSKNFLKLTLFAEVSSKVP